MILASALVCLACMSIQAPQVPIASDVRRKLLEFAIRSWEETPKMEIEDAYKWLFHATQGGDHAVLDDEGPRQWLDAEWQTLGQPLRREPEFVPLDPEGRLIRVNLRPYRAAGGDREMLLEVFMESAKRFKPDKQGFKAVWDLLGATLRGHRIGRIQYDDWRRLDLRSGRSGFPAIEHSKAFLRTYRPAYRVVLGSMWVRSTL